MPENVGTQSSPKDRRAIFASPAPEGAVRTPLQAPGWRDSIASVISIGSPDNAAMKAEPATAQRTPRSQVPDVIDVTADMEELFASCFGAPVGPGSKGIGGGQGCEDEDDEMAVDLD